MERLGSKRVLPSEIIGRETARSLAAISSELNRTIGLLIHRSGKIEAVVVGDYDHIMIPALSGIGTGGGRLRGLRCVRTHLGKSHINDEDIMDMVCLRLDMFSVLTMRDGLPDLLHSVHMAPDPVNLKGWSKLEPVHPGHQHESCLELINALENEFVRLRPLKEVDTGIDRAILVHVTTGSKYEAEESLLELTELARAADVTVLDSVIQRRRTIHPRFIIGRGKLMEIMLASLRFGANLLIFDRELSPSQVRSVTDHTDLRVIDRTQLILDIFARRALSREGKLQVEMAQLKYMLPHLSTRDDALSRLTGGIGARGPGETKLEIDRRRINDRIARLGKDLKAVGKERYHRRTRRRKRDVPVISLVGYTNAGKSTLLNTLTNSQIVAEDMLFATLDPTSRRLRFPHDMEVIITDTVGFIRNLPTELLKAFQSTLEELEEADLLVHVIDLANPAHKEQCRVVDDLIHNLDLGSIPYLRVYNKVDLVSEQKREQVEGEGGICVSAINAATLTIFFKRAEAMLNKVLNK